MERLTTRYDGHAVMAWEYEEKYTTSEWIDVLTDRLAAYEDFMERWRLGGLEEAGRIFRRVNALGGTDLMAQYRDLGPIEHLREFVQADKEGRLVVLPEESEELTEEEIAMVTGYKCPTCIRHALCTTPGMRPLCGEIYDHFVPKSEAVLKKREEADNETN